MCWTTRTGYISDVLLLLQVFSCNYSREVIAMAVFLKNRLHLYWHWKHLQARFVRGSEESHIYLHFSLGFGTVWSDKLQGMWPDSSIKGSMENRVPLYTILVSFYIDCQVSNLRPEAAIDTVDVRYILPSGREVASTFAEFSGKTKRTFLNDYY